MVIITLVYGKGYKGITGKAISTALKKLPEKMSWHCEIKVSNDSAYEFVPRIAERHPREKISFIFSKNGAQYLIGIDSLNPRIRYREIIFSVQEFDRTAEGKNKEASYRQVAGTKTKDFEILCSEIVQKLLQEIQQKK